MKKILCLVLAAAMILSLCACGGSTVQEEEPVPQLKIGFGKVNVTPNDPISMIGSSTRGARISEGLISYLFATCIAVQWGSELYLMYTVDNLSIAENAVVTLREAIVAEFPDIKPENIFLGATHIHNGPPHYGSGNTAEGKYHNEFYNNIVSAARLAQQDLAPATMEVCKFQLEGMNFIRHYTMNDGTVAGVNFGSLASGYKEHVYDANHEMILINFPREGKEAVIMVNWAAHPADPYDAAIGYLNICADYPGWCRDQLEKLTGAKVAYFNGASGDVIPKSHIKEINHGLNAKEYGVKLAELAYEHIGELQPVEVDTVRATGQSVTCNIEHELEHLLAQCMEVKELYDQGLREESDALAWSLGLSSCHHANNIVSRSKLSATEKKEINAFRIGPVSFTTGTYEMASEHATELRAASPFAYTFQICGNAYYIPREEAIDYRSYEGDTRRYTRETGDMLVEKYIEMLNAIK